MDRKGMSHEAAGRLGAEKSAVGARQRKIQRMVEYAANPKLCPVCGVAIPYDKKTESTYCSRSCAATANNIKHPRRKPRYSIGSAETNKTDTIDSTQLSRVCPVCGGKHSNRRSLYCSATCAANRYYAKHVRNIEESGVVPTDPNGEANRRVVGRYLADKFGRRCSICGITEWNGKPAPLVVDHIDGDSSNNRVDNFRLVCGNCDMQLPTYKSKNKSKRAWRKSYYGISGTPSPAKRKFVRLRCMQCGEEFVRSSKCINAADSDRFYSCSRSCSVKWSHTIRSGVLSEADIAELRKSNIIEFFEK